MIRRMFRNAVLVMFAAWLSMAGLVAADSGVKGGDEDFGVGSAVWESHWYSRYNFFNLVMTSGMGTAFMPPMDAMQMAMGMVDATQPNKRAGNRPRTRDIQLGRSRFLLR